MRATVLKSGVVEHGGIGKISAGRRALAFELGAALHHQVVVGVHRRKRRPACRRSGVGDDCTAPVPLDTKINGGLGVRRSMLAPSFAEVEALLERYA